MNILYAGDSPAGGPANYLLGILKFLKADVTHIPPGKSLEPRFLKKRYDAIILSDFSRKDLPAVSERLIAEQVKSGAGLLMVGGWGSFSGPSGKWRGSLIEKLLPVSCLPKDDRRNIWSGLTIVRKTKHPMLGNLPFTNPPVLCGLNEVRVKKSAKVILAARAIVGARSPRPGGETPPLQLTLNPKEYPLLVIDKNPDKRIAAFTTDFAPHWCGGLVDWGNRRKVLKVNSKIRIEVGDKYIKFISALILWLARREF